MPQTAATTPDAIWVAYANGVGHAYIRSGARGQRSLCTDVRRLEERWERPDITERCPTCTEVLTQLTKDSLVEGEARAMWGLR